MRDRLRDLLHQTAAGFGQSAREGRMNLFIELFSPGEGARILDLGGTAALWRLVETPLEVTIVNLPGVKTGKPDNPIHKLHFLEGDATNLTQFEDGAFDIVFSNSVIEHVGPEDRQAAFAREARRLAPRYWVQTPSIWFPIEAHTRAPFWFFYPEGLRRAIIERWRRRIPEWARMVEETTVLKRAELQEFFPDATIYTERSFGFPKSYVAYRV